MKRASLLLILTALLLFQPNAVQAQSAPSCSFQPDGSIFCTTGGGNDGGGGDDVGDNGEGGVCTPGDHMVYQVSDYGAGANTCTATPVWVDNCTGQVLESAGDTITDLPCALPSSNPPQHPYTTFRVSAGGVTCGNGGWNLSARVTFPQIYLDVRPYPATLVRWPTGIRNGGTPESSGSGGVNYISYGGGSPSNPQEGDWQDLRLTLTLRPASPMFVTLPHIGDLILSNQGGTGSPTSIQWEVPSHPAVGGGPLAGSISGLDELPDDIPLFVGNGRAAYKLFWELRYYVYEGGGRLHHWSGRQRRLRL